MGRRAGSWGWFHQCLIGPKWSRSLAEGGPMQRGLACNPGHTLVNSKIFIILAMH